MKSTRDTSKCCQGLSSSELAQILNRTKAVLDKYQYKEILWKKEKSEMIKEIEKLKEKIKEYDQIFESENN